MSKKFVDLGRFLSVKCTLSEKGKKISLFYSTVTFLSFTLFNC